MATYTGSFQNLIRRLRILLLRLRAGILESEIEHAHGLLLDHRLRLQNCQLELRKLRAKEAMLTPASSLLAQAMRRKP